MRYKWEIIDFSFRKTDDFLWLKVMGKNVSIEVRRKSVDCRCGGAYEYRGISLVANVEDR